jgi:hypothetical protein
VSQGIVGYDAETSGRTILHKQAIDEKMHILGHGYCTAVVDDYCLWCFAFMSDRLDERCVLLLVRVAGYRSEQ